MLTFYHLKGKCMEDTTKSTPDQPSKSAEGTGQKVQPADNETSNWSQFQHPDDILVQLCSIADDMKGKKGKLDGLFGM